MPHSSRPEVLLLGGDGFIGHHIAISLERADWTVWKTVYFTPAVRDDQIFLDITERTSWDSMTATLTKRRGTPPLGMILVNATGVLNQNAPTALMRKVHVDGMRFLLEWGCRHRAHRVVQLSSVAVYGLATLGRNRKESNTRRRRGLLAPLPYGRTKAQAEALLEASSLPWCAPRFPAVFGETPSFLTEALKRFVVDSQGQPPIWGSAEHPVSLITVEDAASVVVKLLDHPPCRRAFNVAGAHPSWREILQEAARSAKLPLKPRVCSPLSLWGDAKDKDAMMMKTYARFGAEFPDEDFRGERAWVPTQDWRTVLMESLKAEIRSGEAAPWP